MLGKKFHNLATKDKSRCNMICQINLNSRVVSTYMASGIPNMWLFWTLCPQVALDVQEPISELQSITWHLMQMNAPQINPLEPDLPTQKNGKQAHLRDWLQLRQCTNSQSARTK